MNTKAITNETIIAINWADQDPRSVKASLNGKGDGRVLWWEINQRIQRLVRPTATLEGIMFSFHSRHHAITLFILSFKIEVNRIAAIIRSEGVVVGIRNAAYVTGNHPQR